jgi:transcriptional regulator with XRE-family HTH domain
LTQRELAELTGLSLDLVRRVEQGGTSLQLNKLLHLLDALNGELIVVEKPSRISVEHTQDGLK